MSRLSGRQARPGNTNGASQPLPKTVSAPFDGGVHGPFDGPVRRRRPPPRRTTANEGEGKMLFHDKTVLQYVEAASGDLNVSILSDSSSCDSIRATTAGHRAKADMTAFGSGRLDFERTSATQEKYPYGKY